MAFGRKGLLLCVSGVLLGAALAWSAMSPDVTAVSVAANEFCFALCRNVARGEQENVVFSPLSVATALAMAYAGAKGDTAQEMERVMYWGLEREAGLKALGQLALEQKKSLNSNGMVWRSANGVWVQAGLPLLEEYRGLVRATLSASVESSDFSGNLEDTRRRINAWVRNETRGLIPELLSAQSLSPMTRMALINAAYFKGDWAAAFPKGNTAMGSFFVTPDSPIPVSMMKRDGRYAYLRTASTDIVRLPYRGYKASMLVLLPRRMDGLRELEQTLTADQLNVWIGELQERLIRVELPRFEVEAQYELAPALSRMGMKSAFSDDADFSGITGGRDLKIGAVIHRAKITVDEEGAEAAAAAGVMMQLTSAAPGREPVVFRADHPFMFVILDETTGTILFAGHVVRPSSD